MLLYDIVISLLAALAALLGLFLPARPRRKFMKFVAGQRHAIRAARLAVASLPTAKRTVWVHCASLGEYGVARPLIAAMEARGARVVLTFFSPSGYEAAPRTDPQTAVCYLPLDTPLGARRFLDTVRPDAAVFIVSEYWYNYLRQLRRRGIPTFLVSAKINPDSAFFKWYGWLHRGCLKAFTRFFVIDDRSRQLLARLGYGDSVTLSGNPLFDNAIQKAATAWSDPVIERFCAGRDVFIAGSIHDERDREMVCRLAEAYPDVPMVFVPHAITDECLRRLREGFKGGMALHSQCRAQTDFSGIQVLVIDFVGALAYIYRYCRWAYIGGGFTPYLHSLVEAVVYGLPVSFGPCIRRKITPEQLAELGIGTIVETPQALVDWLGALRGDPERCRRIAEEAQSYVQANAGATGEIVATIAKYIVH